jgi:Family of unknown function (DUF6533)
MGLEINLVWPAPWSLGKVLYFLTAYIAFVDSGMNIFINRLLLISSQYHMCRLKHQ